MNATDSGLGRRQRDRYQFLLAKAKGRRFVVSSFLLAVWVSCEADFVLAQTPPPDSFNPDADRVVSTMVVQADGKILIGGRFTTVGGQPRANLARLNADGTLDSGFAWGPSNEVSSLVVQADGKILVGGWFTRWDGPYSCLVRLNADGTRDSAFRADAQRFDGYLPSVSSLAVQADGKILVGGSFTRLDAYTRDGLARLNTDGTVDAGFYTDVGGTGYNHWVSTLAVQADGKILVGGRFTTTLGWPRTNIARLNLNGTVDTEFDPGADGPVRSLLVLADGRILVGGDFAMLGGQPRSCLARLNPDGTVDAGFNIDANSEVSSLVAQADRKILVGGGFTVLGGQPRHCLARLNADGTLDTGFDPRADGDHPTLYSLAVQSDGKILVGGDFTTLGEQPRNFIGRLNNTEPASQTLTYDGSRIIWLRGGTSPEVWRTTFEHTTNGATWADLGAGTRIPGGWQLTGVSLPPEGTIRARGQIAGGAQNGSAWFVDATLAAPWPIWLNLVPSGSNVILRWSGGMGPYQVQETTNLGNASFWKDVGEAVRTNSMLLPVGPRNLFLRVRGL